MLSSDHKGVRAAVENRAVVKTVHGIGQGDLQMYAVCLALPVNRNTTLRGINVTARKGKSFKEVRVDDNGLVSGCFEANADDRLHHPRHEIGVHVMIVGGIHVPHFVKGRAAIVVPVAVGREALGGDDLICIVVKTEGEIAVLVLTGLQIGKIAVKIRKCVDKMLGLTGTIIDSFIYLCKFGAARKVSGFLADFSVTAPIRPHRIPMHTEIP